ncbi:hypothetical protein A2619_03425 [candidate division WWE3 bacterium RIFOXYD1_FULL_39_9]|uniref:Uncharacterized protein n=1 Tax=candidate division WWE3 bacterium RIFOXYD1_FULL_39_9 TaxID=1802649 RepID=A0A1F4X5M4_UNCKA|nr:MAG: hypothetical protein A2619_03425 [candidate division WWE3 bacterium RIFOXYD1_FULL_39_9]
MKKMFFLILACFALMLNTSTLFAAARPDGKKTMYLATALSGGASGALDAFDITGAGTPNTYDLVDGDTCIVTTLSSTTGTSYSYVFDVDGTDAESSPSIIRPDDYDTAGVWRLAVVSMESLALVPSTSPGFDLYDSDNPGTDKWTASFEAAYVDGADGAENSDILIYINQGGTKTLVLQFDESDDQWETSKAINSSGGFVGALTGNASTATAAASQAITDNAIITADAADIADNDYAKFTANGVEGRSYSEVLSDIGAAATAHTTQYSATPVVDDADNFDDNFTSDNLYGGTFIANAAGTIILPDPAVGMNFTIVLETTGAVIVDPLDTGTADTIVMNGLAAAADENITAGATGALGDMCVFQYRAANSWMATCTGWAEATPP